MDFTTNNLMRLSIKLTKIQKKVKKYFCISKNLCIFASVKITLSKGYNFPSTSKKTLHVA